MIGTPVSWQSAAGNKNAFQYGTCRPLRNDTYFSFSSHHQMSQIWTGLQWSHQHGGSPGLISESAKGWCMWGGTYPTFSGRGDTLPYDLPHDAFAQHLVARALISDWHANIFNKAVYKNFFTVQTTIVKLFMDQSEVSAFLAGWSSEALQFQSNLVPCCRPDS